MITSNSQQLLQPEITKRILSLPKPPGKSPRAFGPSTWICLHVAARYTSSLTNPNFKIVVNTLVHILPCSNCRRNHTQFRDELQNLEPVNTPQEWVNAAHNFVNRLHGKTNWGIKRTQLVTERLYSKPVIMWNAIFKLVAILISHWEPNIPTQAFLRSLFYLLPLDNRNQRMLLNIVNQKWYYDPHKKINLLIALDGVRQEVSFKLSEPHISDLSQWYQWINQACYGDIADVPIASKN